MKSLLMKSALRSASCLQALSLTGLAVGAIAVSAPAVAQDLTAGAIAGSVTDEAGAAVAGASVTLTSQSQGFSRTSTSTSNGGFRFTGLPTGSYTITVEADDFDSFTASDVRVLASQTVDVSIPLTTTGNVIVVTGTAILRDFAGSTSGVNVDLQELVKTVPLGRDISSVALLAPGTSTGDNAFGNLVSIGGSSVAENAYYLNGLNITNFDNYLGSVEVPFDFYRTVEVKSGGYPAEFGRATGGIINAVSKAGSNEFTGAVHFNYAPDWTRSSGTERVTCDAEGNCTDLTYRAKDESDSYSVIVEAGGPVIEDRLFVYGLVSLQNTESLIFDRSSGLASHRKNDDPFWAVKVDAYPVEDHHFEFTIFDTRNTTVRRNLGFTEDAAGGVTLGAAETILEYNFGGLNFVGKYTGHLTDWLSISGAYGRMRDRFDIQGIDAGSGAPFYQNASGSTVNGTPNGGLLTGQPTSVADFPYTTERKFYRGDVDLFFSLFGDHHIRGGFDVENNTLVHTTVRPGEAVLCGTGFLSSAACTQGGGAALLLRPNWSPAAQELITADVNLAAACAITGDCLPNVEINYLNTGGGFQAQNKAFYIQDEWSVTDRLTLSLGLRRDDFSLEKPDGTRFAETKGNYAPRIGATYNMWEDHSGKIRAFYGQYFLPFASNTAFRQGGSEIYHRERWFYNGFDGNGLPVLTDQVVGYPAYTNGCPFGLTDGSSGEDCSVTGDGSVPDTSASVAHNLKSTKETEWIIGYEHRLGDWTVGLSYTHRNLDISAEDMAIDAAVNAWCAEQGIDCTTEDGDPIWTGYHQYVITNPGNDLVVNLYGLDGREVTLTAEQLGYPKAKRKYDAVEFTFAHPFNGTWSLNGSYTWSKSKGNSEGFVQSDFGQDDAGITQDFDQPGFTEHAYGYLPNHRTHRFKLWGSYAITDRFLVGTNVQVQSPRRLSCFGYYPVRDAYENGYGAASHYCGGEPAPRGEGLRTGWYKQVDLSLRYNIDAPTGQTVTLRSDIFNIFNSKAVMQRNEVGENGYLSPNPNYGQPTLYQSPRYVRFGADIAF